MKTISYRIKFHSDWHCGSGLVAGADVDALVVKDKDGLPFVPGRTIKGMLREAIDVIFPEEEELKKMFGKEESDSGDGVKSVLFFSNAVMLDEERQPIVQRPNPLFRPTPNLFIYWKALPRFFFKSSSSIFKSSVIIIISPLNSQGIVT